MKITFVANGCEQLPISLLAAIAQRQGHQVGLAFSSSLFNDRYGLNIPKLASFFDDRNNVIEAIREQAPDVLACSVLSNLNQWMLGIAREAKEMLPHLKVIFGGVHPSAVPGKVLENPEVDFVCVGEGDIAFPQLLRELENGGPNHPLPNIHYHNEDGTLIQGPQSGFIQDLDSLPFFDKQLWEDHIRIGDLYMTMASRGCPYRCTFCFNSYFANLPGKNGGKYVRQRSVEHMIGELREAKKRYTLRFIDFEDDVFTFNKAWLSKFLDLYKKEINVPFMCLTHPRYMDDDIAKWMADAGCQWVQMGIQSVDDSYKLKQLKRNENSDHVLKAMDALKKNRIQLKTDHIFGLPGEELSSQQKALEFYATYTPNRISTFWATYFPGTILVDQAKNLGFLTEADVQKIESGHSHAYHDSGNVKESELLFYQGYEVLFKMFPLLPPAIRMRLSPKVFERLNFSATQKLGVVFELANALIKRSPDHYAYGMHYQHTIKNTFAKLLRNSV